MSISRAENPCTSPKPRYIRQGVHETRPVSRVPLVYDRAMSRVVGGNRAQRHVVAEASRLFGQDVTVGQLERWAGEGLGPRLHDKEVVDDTVIAHYASIAKGRRSGPQATDLLPLELALRGAPVIDQYVRRGLMRFMDKLTEARSHLATLTADRTARGVSIALPTWWKNNEHNLVPQRQYDYEGTVRFDSPTAIDGVFEEDVDGYIIEDQRSRRKSGNNSKPEETTVQVDRHFDVVYRESRNERLEQHLHDSLSAGRRGGPLNYPELAAEAVRGMVPGFPVQPAAFNGDHASAAEIDDFIRNRWSTAVIPEALRVLRGLEQLIDRYSAQTLVVEPFTFLREVVSDLILAERPCSEAKS